MYCKVCSKHFSISHGGIGDVRSHGEGKKHLELQNGFLKKNHRFSARCLAFFFKKLNMSALAHDPSMNYFALRKFVVVKLAFLWLQHEQKIVEVAVNKMWEDSI